MLKALSEIAWFKAAFKEFKTFSQEAQAKIFSALNLAAQVEKAKIAKPMEGLGAGVFEAAVKRGSDAYRTVYAVRIDDKLWILHAFKKKSRRGVKTPKQDIDLIKRRIKVLREMANE